MSINSIRRLMSFQIAQKLIHLWLYLIRLTLLTRRKTCLKWKALLIISRQKLPFFYFAIANLSTFTNSFTNFLRTNVLFTLCEKCTSLDIQDFIRIVITIKCLKLYQLVNWYSFHNFLWIKFWHIPT